MKRSALVSGRTGEAPAAQQAVGPSAADQHDDAPSQEAGSPGPLRFNVWLVVLLALMPVLVMVAGMSAAGGLRRPAEFDVMGVVILGALVAAFLARRYAAADE